MSAGGAESATLPYRARFDECGPDGALRPSAYLRWAQDVAWVHSTRLGFGRDWYGNRGLAWLVRAVDLSILAAIPTGVELTVTTRVVGWRHVLARRRTDFVAPSAGLVAIAFTDWAMTDAAGAPTRIPEEFPARFAAPAGSFTPIRVTPGSSPARATLVREVVRPHELDPMGHVNNAVYLDYVQDALVPAGPDGAVPFPTRYRLEYLLAAGPGDELLGRVWRDGDELLYVLSRASGEKPDAADTAGAGADRMSADAGVERTPAPPALARASADAGTLLRARIGTATAGTSLASPDAPLAPA